MKAEPGWQRLDSYNDGGVCIHEYLGQERYMSDTKSGLMYLNQVIEDNNNCLMLLLSYFANASTLKATVWWGTY